MQVHTSRFLQQTFSWKVRIRRSPFLGLLLNLQPFFFFLGGRGFLTLKHSRKKANPTSFYGQNFLWKNDLIFTSFADLIVVLVKVSNLVSQWGLRYVRSRNCGVASQSAMSPLIKLTSAVFFYS